MVKRFGFGRKEKLKSRKQIDALFLQGKRFAQFPIRVTYQFQPSGGLPGTQLGVTAAKKNFKKATDRNRIKRLLREAYRVQKEELNTLLLEKDLKALVFLMYADNKLTNFETVKEAVRKALIQLVKAVKNYHHEDPS